MRDNGKNGKKHNDPHRDLHTGSGGAQETGGDKHRNSASDSHQSASQREGGYGVDSGYSDHPGKPQDDARSGKSAKRSNPNTDRSRSE